MNETQKELPTPSGGVPSLPTSKSMDAVSGQLKRRPTQNYPENQKARGEGTTEKGQRTPARNYKKTVFYLRKEATTITSSTQATEQAESEIPGVPVHVLGECDDHLAYVLL